VFLYDGHFLRDPRLLIDLLKPLLYHNILHFGSGYKSDFLINTADLFCDGLLELLQKESVPDHLLLPKLKAWSSPAPQSQSSMLNFFNSTFMISAIRANESDGPPRSLVTARLFDPSDGARQRKARAMADDTEACASFHALYALPSAHVGFIARMMPALQKLQPKKVKLTVYCAQNHVCMDRAQSRCAVSMRPLSDVFAFKLASVQDVLQSGEYSHALVISSNDDGLFAFVARCTDAMMQSGCCGSKHHCWLAHTSSAAGSDWRPTVEDWVMLNSPENPKSLSEVLSANASGVVVPSNSLKLRDVLPRIFISHTYSGDGTGE
jgi:hypothetical protein